MGNLGETVRGILRGPHGGFVKFAAVVFAGFFIYIAFLGDDCLVRWAKAGLEIRRQRNQMEVYRKEIAAMDKQIRMLSTDRDTLEEFSRETFHFAAPGDDVYLLKK